MKLLRYIFRFLGKFYKKEYGKYTILTKYFFPYFATKSNDLDIITVNKKFKMSLDTSEYIQGHLFVFDCFEPDTILLIEQITKKGDVILDVGANIGYLSLVFAHSTGSGGKVYSFEPEQNNYNKLLKNISLNSYNNIESHKIAFSNKETKIKLFKSKDNNLGSHSLIYNPDVLDEEFEFVDTITCDKFITDNNIMQVDIIKIDVEGAEYEVLQGMTNTLELFRPLIIMEINNPIQEKRNIPSEKLKRIVINKNYTAYNITPDGNIEFSPLDFKHNIDNILFLPNEKIKDYNSIIK